MLTDTEKGYKKAAGILKKVCAFDPKDHGARLLWGELEIRTKKPNRREKNSCSSY